MTKMKRMVLISAIAVIIALSGCGAKDAAKKEVEKNLHKEETALDPIALEIKEFKENYVNTNERPIAVMVDNDDKNARPHAGLQDAYLIYEMIIEGGSTRFMALYRGTDTEKIGPIRSSRHYYLDYVMENDAIYTHFGWSPRAMQDISKFGINKINGVLGGDENIFWREKKYKGDWHSAYTSIKNIKDMASKKSYKLETEHKNCIEYSDSYIELPPENIAKTVNLKYSYKYTTAYRYNEETHLYEKSIDGEPHVMQSGDVLSMKNIIIMFIGDSALGDGSDRRNINTTGKGTGFYITNGAFEEIVWEKPSRSENTVYKKADGTPLLINPGKTIVNIISPLADASIE